LARKSLREEFVETARTTIHLPFHPAESPTAIVNELFCLPPESISEAFVFLVFSEEMTDFQMVIEFSPRKRMSAQFLS
jgi:hypothetical protein